MITVFLSNKTLQVVSGSAGNSVRANAAGSAAVMERCVINGIVTDNEVFVAELSSFWNKYKLKRKDIRLVVDSSQFITRLVNCPPLNDKKTLEFIKLDFASVERATDPIFSYFPLPAQSTGKLRCLFVTMVERGFIKNYIDLFAQAGIQLSSVEPAIACALRLLTKVRAVNKGVSLVQIADDMSLTSMLFEDGKYAYSDKIRLVAERDTAEFCSEVARSVSNIIQFEAARGVERSIETLHFAGFSEGEILGCTRELSVAVPSITCGKLNLRGTASMRSVDPTDFLYPLGGLTKGAGAALLAQYRVDDEKLKKSGRRRKILVPAITLFVILLLITAGLFYRLISLQASYHALTTYNTSPAIAEKREEYTAAKAEEAKKAEAISALRNARADIESYPLADSSLNVVLDRCAAGLAEIAVLGYNRENGVLRVSATSPEVSDINVFIERLKHESAFADVSYSGYTFIEKSNVWAINVVCYLAGGASEVDE